MTSCTPIRLAFTCWDPEEGASSEPPIIFCHGLTASKEHWGTIAKTVANATKRKVYSIDARNHGDTEWSEVFTFETNADDLLHFMDTIGAEKATIVGHSMGGSTAMRTALRAPGRVAGIVVEDMGISEVPQDVLDIIKVMFAVGKAILAQLPPGTSEDEAKNIIFDELLKRLSPGMGSIITKASMDPNLVQFKRLPDGRLAYKSNVELIENSIKKPEDLIPGYEGLYEGPACFIYGEISSFNVRGDESKIKKLFPNAELEAIENATHNVHSECRDEFTSVLLKFLTK